MSESALSVWRIVGDALAEAPAKTRRSGLAALALWLTLMTFQAFDSADRPGPGGVAEFLSALCGSAGGVLLGVCGVLNAGAERKAAALRTAAEADAYRRVLIALPAVGVAAGALLAAAVALMVMRGLLGADMPLVVILTALFAIMLWFAAAIVMQAARTLYAHAQHEAREASEARLAAGDARLAALQARMNPHFLFNALNTVAALARTEPAAAERVTENLAGVLRMTLERSAERLGSVAEEVDYVRAWLEVERERWKERLRVNWDVDPHALDAAVPPLILQPLVENALRHGIGSRLDGGTIGISVRRAGTDIHLCVTDDGVGFVTGSVERTGLGNLRQRLAAIYGPRASLSIDRPDRGAMVSVRVPYQEAVDARPRR